MHRAYVCTCGLSWPFNTELFCTPRVFVLFWALAKFYLDHPPFSVISAKYLRRLSMHVVSTRKQTTCLFAQRQNCNCNRETFHSFSLPLPKTVNCKKSLIPSLLFYDFNKNSSIYGVKLFGKSFDIKIFSSSLSIFSMWENIMKQNYVEYLQINKQECRKKTRRTSHDKIPTQYHNLMHSRVWVKQII